jgi:3-oxoacyl-[acyl-carrier-protein] synthase-3
MIPVSIVGIGSYLPSRIVDNVEIARQCGVDPSWISRRTGIETRHVASDKDTLSYMAASAAEKAMAQSGVTPDLIILASSVPERPMPPTAPVVQHKLGLRGTPALDINAACAGFLYGVSFGYAAIQTGLARNPVVIGADMLAKYTDRTDPRTAPIFGAGAGAVVLGQVADSFGVLSTDLRSEGALADLVTINLLDSPADQYRAIPQSDYFRMQGREVSAAVRRLLTETVRASLDRAGLSIQQIDRMFIHQANVRLVEELGESIGARPSQIMKTGGMVGNLGAASVPVGLDLSNAESPLRPGELVCLASIGSGISAGSVIVRWH